MGQPRRRFPGGSVGQFFVIPPGTTSYTEAEALEMATKMSAAIGERVYIGRYINHVDPPEGSSA